MKLLVLACITAIQVDSQVKGLQGVNCQYFVGELDICLTPSNGDTKLNTVNRGNLINQG